MKTLTIEDVINHLSQFHKDVEVWYGDSVAYPVTGVYLFKTTQDDNNETKNVVLIG